MIITDTLLAERQKDGKPIRVAMVGAGFMGRGLVNQIVNSTPGMEIVSIVARKPEQGVRAFTEAGVTDPEGVARQVMLLHEGALVTLGMGVDPDACARARDLAVSLVGRG